MLLEVVPVREEEIQEAGQGQAITLGLLALSQVQITGIVLPEGEMGAKQSPKNPVCGNCRVRHAKSGKCVRVN